VLDTIRKSGVTDAVVVVTRYFGGILLGAGGLVRAYSHTAKLALEAAHIITYEQYTEMELVCSYSDYQKYQAELPRFGAVIDDTQFSDRVTLLFSVKDPVVEDVFARVREISNGSTVPTVRGKRFDYR
jgi:putative IMPACT (imprinted ancient) family translation regulator